MVEETVLDDAANEGDYPLVPELYVEETAVSNLYRESDDDDEVYP